MENGKRVTSKKTDEKVAARTNARRDRRTQSTSGFGVTAVASAGQGYTGKQGETAPRDPFSNIGEGRLVLLGGDEYAVMADGRRVLVTPFRELLKGSGKSAGIVAAFETPSAVVWMEARGPRKPFELLAALEDGSVWAFDLAGLVSLRRSAEKRGCRREPKQRLLADGVKGLVRGLFATRSRTILVTQACDGQRYILHDVDSRAGRVRRSAELPFAGVTSVAPLDASRSDTLVVMAAGYEARLVSFADASDAATLSVAAFEGPSRVTAAAILDNRYLVVAQKGGEVLKAPVSLAGMSTQGQQEAIARACRVLRIVLKACGCACRCKCDEKDPRPPRPGGDGGEFPGGHVDDEPCDEKHQTHLGWTVNSLRAAGPYVIAFSANHERMAVLDRQLNVVLDRYLGRRGAVVASGQSSTDRMLIYRARPSTLEAWSLTDYARNIRGIDPAVFVPDLPLRQPAPSSVTYYGHRRGPTLPNPHLRAAVFTVTEPGQPFTDANQSKLQAQIEPNVFDIVKDYHDENSFGELEVHLDVFGVDFGGTRKPLVLPQPVAAYFYDDFTPGGVEAVMPADWGNPLVLDGAESLTIRSHPRVGDGKDYPIPFAALWTTHTHNTFPVAVDFAGTEAIEITVEDQEGASHLLGLNFGVLHLSHNQGDDENAFLQALGTFVTDTIRAAESVLPGSPTTLADIVFRRIRTSSDDSVFGLLQGQFVISPPGNPADATQKGAASITSVPVAAPGLTALGLDGGGSRDGVLASANQTRDYLQECLSAAQRDAGEGPGLDDPHFATNPDVTEDAGAMELTVRINLSSEKGGQGATLEVIDHDGLAGSGWENSTQIPGSESDANNQNTMRYYQQLSDDVFTAALDHIRATTAWDAEAVRAMFADYDAMMIGFVGSPPAGLPPGDPWGSVDPADFGRLRMFVRHHFATDQNNPDPADPPVSMGTDLLIGQKFNTFNPGVMAHELGHGLGLPDLYYATGFRDDVRYVDAWEMMGGGNSNFNHFGAWSKWSTGWLVEDPGNDDLNRVVDVPLPEPSGTSVTEAWLVPIEYWDSAMKADVRAVVGGTLPIVQMMKVHLGSDGGVVNLIELRAPGITYSQNLPPTPAVIATNVLAPGTDRRWAVNGLYRRSVHLLNGGDELRNTGDKWDFAAGQEFPLKGCTVEVMDSQTIRGGSIPVFLLRVEREAADYVDLFFQDNIPSWRSPDLWVDWPADNADPAEPRVYPEGTPTDQGETVRFPSSGVEPHFMVTRVHNAGTVRAEDVKVRWFICDPPGAGDDGRWVQKDTKTIPEVGPGTWEIEPFTWNVDSSTSSHQCLRAEIIDWTIPTEVDPGTGDTLHLASDDVLLQNNNAQKNVFDFEALSGSPFDLTEFEFQVHNDAKVPEVAYLVPTRMPWGMTLEISPAEAAVAAGKNVVFRCKLNLDDRFIRPGCSNDQGFLLTAWRRAHDADEKWGSCFYHVRPRLRTALALVRGYWYDQQVSVYGLWKVLSDQPVNLAEHLPLFVRLRFDLYGSGGHKRTFWRTAAIQANGSFHVTMNDVKAEDQPGFANVQAWFDRTDLFGSSVSKLMQILHSPPVG